jgi:integrase
MLRKRGKYWHVQVKVNGHPWNRSTGETNLERAKRKEPGIIAQAQLRRNRSPESLSFDRAVVREVERLEFDVSRQAAQRADYCFHNFQVWLGRDLDLDLITTALLERFQRERLRTAALSTVTRELGAITVLLRENGFAVATPRRKPGRKTKQRHFTDDELVRFFSHVEGYHKTLFLFLLATGARPAEVIPSAKSSHVALLKSEVCAEENSVMIRPAKVKPGEDDGKTRKILIPESLLLQLVALQTRGAHVFRSNSNLHTLFDRICEKAEIDKMDALGRKVTAHSFRHTFARKLSRITGGDQFVLKATLGHSQISTTEIYNEQPAYGEALDLEALLDQKTG